MAEQLDQAESFPVRDYMAPDEYHAAGRQVPRLLVGPHSYPPGTLAIVDLRIPGLLTANALTAEEVASAAGKAPDGTARFLRAGIAA
jgi:hypothetical protein